MRIVKSICCITVAIVLKTLAVQAADVGNWLMIQSDSELSTHKIEPLQKFSTAKKREEYILQVVQSLKNEMYIEASIDSVWGENTDTLKLYLHIGEQYELDVLVPDERVRKSKHPINFLSENMTTTLLSIENQLEYWENNGYPFAQIIWDSLSIDSNRLQMKAKLEKGPLILFDSLKNREDGKVSEAFLRTYLGMKKEMPYRESLLTESDQLLKKLPFVRFVKNSNVHFYGDKATLNVYLASRKVSKFDFLIGLLPNNKASGKMLITGEARLQLQNAFRRGEEIFFEWKRMRQNSQQLRLRFNYPYILQSPIGASGMFFLDKRDSTLLDINWSLGVPFRTKANNYIKAYLENDQSIVLYTDTIRVKSRKQLPEIQDYSSLLYGMEGYYENLDYLFNPRRGVELRANAQIGTKKIKPNYSIVQLGREYEQLYDTIKLRTLQAQFSASAQVYLSLSKRQVAKLAFSGSSKINKGVADNELYRIGGANLLRGFDEESIFAQHYIVATAEYRFILEQNSYFYAFLDAGFVARKLEEKFRRDFPFGFGAGIAFETKAGVFGVSYAVGREQKNPIDFRTSKLHFGYVNIF